MRTNGQLSLTQQKLWTRSLKSGPLAVGHGADVGPELHKFERVHGGLLVVRVLDCQSRGSGFKSQAGTKFGSRFDFENLQQRWSRIIVHTTFCSPD